jgi:hypothetical protein
VVEDSARADVSVVGDLLGPTLQVSTPHRAFFMQTLPVLYGSYTLEDPAQVEFAQVGLAW